MGRFVQGEDITFVAGMAEEDRAFGADTIVRRDDIDENGDAIIAPVLPELDDFERRGRDGACALAMENAIGNPESIGVIAPGCAERVLGKIVRPCASEGGNRKSAEK